MSHEKLLRCKGVQHGYLDFNLVVSAIHTEQTIIHQNSVEALLVVIKDTKSFYEARLERAPVIHLRIRERYTLSNQISTVLQKGCN